ncbi:MAG: hypothetical protein ACTSRZ_18335 [Promethearchaeota archaeon]
MKNTTATIWQFDYEISNENFNPKMTIFGVFFLCFRIMCMTPFINEDGSFHPEVFHASYIISIFICLSIIFNFRVKPLNIIPVAALPSVIFSIFMHDIPILIDPSSAGLGEHVIGDILWWNFLTIHTPIPILAVYFFFTRKETLSIESYFIFLPVFLTWFFLLDDKQNGTLNGSAYVNLVLGYIVFFTILYVFVFMRKSKVGRPAPLIAPLIKLKSLKLKKIEL